MLSFFTNLQQIYSSWISVTPWPSKAHSSSARISSESSSLDRRIHSSSARISSESSSLDRRIQSSCYSIFAFLNISRFFERKLIASPNSSSLAKEVNTEEVKELRNWCVKAQIMQQKSIKEAKESLSKFGKSHWCYYIDEQLGLEKVSMDYKAYDEKESTLSPLEQYESLQNLKLLIEFNDEKIRKLLKHEFICIFTKPQVKGQINWCSTAEAAIIKRWEEREGGRLLEIKDKTEKEYWDRENRRKQLAEEANVDWWNSLLEEGKDPRVILDRFPTMEEWWHRQSATPSQETALTVVRR